MEEEQQQQEVSVYCCQCHSLVGQHGGSILMTFALDPATGARVVQRHRYCHQCIAARIVEKEN